MARLCCSFRAALNSPHPRKIAVHFTEGPKNTQSTTYTNTLHSRSGPSRHYGMSEVVYQVISAELDETARSTVGVHLLGRPPAGIDGHEVG